MPRIKIPTTGKWNGIFPGETSGTIWLSKNINLQRSSGKISLGDSMTSLYDSDDDGTNLVLVPIAFARTAADATDRWWAMSTKLFKTSGTNPESGWAVDALANTPSAPLYDMIEFQKALLVATATNIDRLSTTWTNNWWSGLTGASAMQSLPHRFWIFAGAALITDGQYINTYDGTIAKDPALTIPAQFQADWIRATGDYAVIGTSNVGDKGEAEIFFWDRAASTFNARYGIGDTAALCGFQTGRGFFIITKKGYIKKFTGTGFDTVQQFPTAEAFDVITQIHPNGVAVDGDVVRILVSFNLVTSTTYMSFRALSGLWTFNPATNDLYHYASPTNNSGLDYSQQELASTTSVFGAGACTLTTQGQGRLLIGARTYKNYAGADNTTRRLSGIFSLDEESTAGRGYIITPKIYSQDVRQFITRLFLRFERFQSSTDRIRILYRTQEDLNFPAYETITWATTTTFTASNANLAVNDFVEILAGDNAGLLAKITTKTGSSAPFTFTIDLTANSSTKDARARYLKFTDSGTLSSQTLQSEVFDIAQRSEWAQFLIEIRGTELSPAVNEMILDLEQVKL